MKEIILHESGLRDGLQMEKTTVPFEKKIEWIDALIEAGMDMIQVGSFVHPVKVPQMADTDKIFRYYNEPGRKPEKVILSGLALNGKGVERAIDCGCDMICVGVSASETHSMKNTRMTVADAADRIIKIAVEAMKSGKTVQASVQSAFGCGFEGNVPKENVIAIAEKYFSAGIKKISLADTAGHGNPYQVADLFSTIMKMDPEAELAAHFHNTYGLGLANCYAAIESGAKFLESAFGGLGGCPFTKLAAGNVCTEDLVHFLQRAGIREDINLLKLIDIAKDLSIFFDRELPGYVYKSGPIGK